MNALLAPWEALLDHVLRPARPALARCFVLRDELVARRRAAAEARIAAMTDCERRITEARAAVFAARDGVVSGVMTSLEREWKRAARVDSDLGMMDFWSRVAPSGWIDRKPWRGAPDAVDLATALAADATNVLRAEALGGPLRNAFGACGVRTTAEVKWRFVKSEGPPRVLEKMLGEARRFALQSAPDDRALQKAYRLRRDVKRLARGRLPNQPHLVADIAEAAFVDFVARASSSAAPLCENPTPLLCELWKTGYVLGEVTETSITLEVAPLPLPATAITNA